MVEKAEPQFQTAIRLPPSLVKRIDKIAESMSKTGIRVTRSEVLRLAAHKGIEQLEAERKKR
jgi:predicted DNA-binding protein